MKNKLPKKDKGLGFLRHWKVMTMTLLLLTFSIGQMWADCEKGTLIFSMEVTSNPASKIQIAAKSGGVNGSLDLAANANVTVVGTSAVMYNSNSSAYDAITTAGEICFKNSSKHWIEISFPCELAAGDLISFTTTKTNPIAFSGTASGTKYSTTDNKLEISTSGTSELIGKTSLWIWRPGSEPNVKSLRIIRPVTITLDATTNGGTTSTTSIKGATGDKVVLPHAFKTGNKFKGWYTAATEGTKRADYYTMSGDETVVAQFEALPSGGEMFSLEMQESMKPIADISLDKGQQRDLLEFATISGGAAIGANTTSSSNHFKITSAGKISFNGTAAYLIINLDFPLAAGDVIATDVSAKTWVTHLSSAPSSGPYVDGTNKSYTIKSTDTDLIGATTLYLWRGSNATLSEITITRPTPHILSYAVSPTGKGTVTLGATSLIEGATTTATYSAIDAAYEFDEWQISGTGATLSSTSTNPTTITMGSTDATVTLKLKAAVTKYTITYSPGANGTGAAIPDGKKDEGVDFTLSDATYSRDGYVQTGWATEDGGAKAYDLGGTYTTDDDLELFPFWTPVYTVTKGTHEHGDFTISPASLVAGGTVTLDPTPDDGYMLSAWEIVKTSDASATGITVTNKQFEMPAYGVTVNATFVADTRQKVLYVTATAEATVKANDKLYAALKDIYNVKIVGSNSDEDQTGYDLIVLHESVGGSDYNKTAVATAKAGNKPVLNTKSYFYNNANTTDQRWNWGTPNAGKSVKGATQNSAYCNIADHPLFAGVTVTDGFFEITDAEAAKCMQPVKTFTTGKEGYTLATTPNNDSGNGTAIHELTPAQRGASAGKYLMISVSNAKLDALNANGQKLFQNAADYLINGTAWEPIVAPTSATIEANGGAAHIVGDEVTLTASATGVSASTLYSWYKGATLEAAQEAGAIQTAETAANNGHKYTIASCELASAGTYWCVITNAVACEASASLELTVSDASYVITFASAHGTAPTATTGVAYTLPELTESGWAHQGWTASIDVTVDAATVEAGTLIANSKMATFGADVTFTAVWAQEFQVTFNLNGHGDPIAAQIVVDGELATDPGNPSEIGYDFGGWFTDEDCTVGNEFDFATPITATTPLFAKWTAFAGCVLLVPATSGDAPAVGDPISMQSGSKGGSMSVIGTPLSYNTYGLGFDSNSSAKAKVTINNEIQEGTVISLTLVANGTSAPRGLHLYSGDGATKIASIGWTSTVVKYTEETFTYTVQSTDVALIGTNEFQLWRNSSVFLKQLAITNCGDPIIYHNLTSEIAPDHDPAYATVTLGASSVREGRTTTATYSDIVSGYEFDEWQISGTGASIADASANPAVITMGTADAVVTLKLKAETPSHTVTFNKMGKGADIAPQSVKEGAKVSEPSVTEPEGYLLEGWYKESTLENKWDFASDVMGTSNIELFANWVADPSIRLINKSTGAINTTNFTTGVTETEANSEKAAAWGGTQGAISGTNAMGKIVQYNAATNQMKIKISAYNTNGSGKEIYIHRILEGEDTEQAVETLAVASNTPVESEYYTFNNTKNRSFYLTTNSTDVKLLQVRVIDDGTAIKQAGQAGYSVNLNKGRLLGPKDTDLSFEGLTCNLSSNYSVINSTEAKLKNDGRSISFTVAAALTLQVTTTNAATYYVTKDAAGTSNETAVAGVSEFDLTAGTWFISAGSSEVKFTKLEFIAPKCAEPAFNSLANSDICSGDLYVALNGTATVADAGVPTYQWYREDNSAIDGETNATYTPSADGKYYVIAVNHLAGFSNNEKKSALVTVTTHAGTAITTGLAHVRKTVGEDATLTVEAEGKNLHYAWKECETIDGSYTDVAGAADNKSLDVVVPDGVKYYKVIVSSDCGDDQESIAKVEKFVELPQLHITGSTTWDLTTCADAEIKLGDTTSPKKGEECLMANIEGVHLDANFNSQALVMSGEYIYRNVTGKPTCAEYMKFITDVEGVVTITFAGNGSNRLIRVTGTNGVQYSTVSSGTGDTHTEKFFVTPGEVELMGMDQALTQDKRYMRFFSISFNATPEYTRPVTEGRFGTICLPNGGVMVGAALFEVAYHDATLEKIFFDEILNGAMVAGRPYIFLPNDGVSELGVFYTDAADASAGNYHGLYGSYTQEVLAKEAGNYILYNNQYMYVGASSTNVSVGANRAYFKIGVEGGIPTNAVAPLPGRRRVSMSAVRETPTGLENGELINGENGVQKVLINGELFILRGEKMYDATGRLVK